MGLSAFSSVDLLIRVVLLGYRLFYQERYTYIYIYTIYAINITIIVVV